MTVEKFCKKCGEVKSADHFQKDKKEDDGLYYVCKICRRPSQRKAQKKYKDKKRMARAK